MLELKRKKRKTCLSVEELCNFTEASEEDTQHPPRDESIASRPAFISSPTVNPNMVTPTSIKRPSRKVQPPPDIPEDIGSMLPRDAFLRWHQEGWMSVTSSGSNKSRMNTCRMAVAYYLLFLDRPPPKLPEGIVNPGDPCDAAKKWRHDFTIMVDKAWSKIQAFFADLSVPFSSYSTVTKFKDAMFNKVDDLSIQWPNGLPDHLMNQYKVNYSDGQNNILKTRDELSKNKEKSDVRKRKAEARRRDRESQEREEAAMATRIDNDNTREISALQEEQEEAGETTNTMYNDMGDRDIGDRAVVTQEDSEDAS